MNARAGDVVGKCARNECGGSGGKPDRQYDDHAGLDGDKANGW